MASAASERKRRTTDDGGDGLGPDADAERAWITPPPPPPAGLKKKGSLDPNWRPAWEGAHPGDHPMLPKKPPTKGSGP